MGDGRKDAGVVKRVHELRNRFVDSPDSFGARRRLLRWKSFADLFPDIGDMRVIDLGGRIDSWIVAPVQPKHVVVLNLDPPYGDSPDWLTYAQGDACQPPPGLHDARFDLVFSNSLIEHVGGHAQRQSLAGWIHQFAERHWIQTPYRYFPIEPHLLFPLFQFLPLAVQWRICRHWPLVHSPPGDDKTALEVALAVELLTRTEMAYYFPTSEIREEKLGPITKSLVAVRT